MDHWVSEHQGAQQAPSMLPEKHREASRALSMETLSILAGSSNSESAARPTDSTHSNNICEDKSSGT